MLRLVLLSALLASGSAMNAHKTIKRDLQNFNNDAACWGLGNAMKWHMAIRMASEECEKFGTLPGSTRPTNPFTTLPANNPFQTLPGDASNPWMNVPAPISNRISPLRQLVTRGSVGNSAAQSWTNMWADFMGGRSKRAAEDGENDEQDIEEFLEDFKDFKQDMVSKLQRLTCVLTKMNLLDAQMQVNLQYFTEEMWSQFDLKQTIAGEDPAWRQKVNQGYTDCHQIASNWPQQSLDRNPITKVFGRHMIFFKCTMVCCMHLDQYCLIVTI
jgi:hypothetical protein